MIKFKWTDVREIAIALVETHPEVKPLEIRFTVLHRWDYYKEDTPYSAFGVVSAVSVGAATDQTVLQQFVKAAPVHGSNPGWLGNLIANHKRWAMNARMSYSNGRNNFALSEFASGISRFHPRSMSWS